MLLLLVCIHAYICDKIGINDTILTKYEKSNAISDLAFQKTLRPAEAWSLDGRSSYYNEHQ